MSGWAFPLAGEAVGELMGLPRVKLKGDTLAPLLAGLLGMLAVLSVTVYSERLQQRQQLQKRNSSTHESLLHLQLLISSEINVAFRTLEVMGDWVACSETVTPSEFAEISRRNVGRHSTLRSTTLLPNDIIALAYPENKKLVGLAVGLHPTQGQAVRRMRELRTPIVTGPIALVQGGEGLILRAPIFRGAEYYGHVSLVFDLEYLAALVHREGKRLGLSVSLEDANKQGDTAKLALRGDSRAAQASDVRVFSIGQEEWRLSAHSLSSQASSSRSQLRFGLGVFLSFVTAALGFWAVRVSLALREKNAHLQLSQKEALAAVKTKAAFLATMSHELRTPMNGVIATSELLEQTELTAEQLELTRTIATSGRALLTVINDILDVSKLEAEKVIIQPEPTSLSALLGDIHLLFKPLAEAKEVSLEFLLEEGLDGYFWLDPTRTRQVIVNYLSNALKFTEKGSVALRARPEVLPDGSLELQVEVVDTGIGIEDTSILFQDFVQADSTTTRRFGGTGLGLAISQRLVHLMGGDVGVQSTWGSGSRFWFSLPLKRVEDTEVVVSQLSHRPLLPIYEGRALVVDDNSVNRTVVVKILSKLGWTVSTANDGAEAVAAVQQGEFDIVFMDCQMPVLDGYEATKKIRRAEQKKGLPIIAMTANAMAEDRELCLASGMSDFLTKPLRINDIRNTLERWVPLSQP